MLPSADLYVNLLLVLFRFFQAHLEKLHADRSRDARGAATSWLSLACGS